MKKADRGKPRSALFGVGKITDGAGSGAPAGVCGERGGALPAAPGGGPGPWCSGQSTTPGPSGWAPPTAPAIHPQIIGLFNLKLTP